MEYYTVIQENDSRLDELVTNLLERGWQCQGGIALTGNPDGVLVYAQAMVRETPAEKTDGK